MAYAAITSLLSTIHQSMQVNECNLQSFYGDIESLRANLEKPFKTTGDHEAALTSLEAEITELAYTTEDMVDLESRKFFLAGSTEERTIALWELFFLLQQAIECIRSTMKQWMVVWDRYISMKDLKLQNLSIADVSQHVVEPENMMVGHENEFKMVQDQLSRGTSELEVVSIVGMGGIGKTTLANKIYNDPFVMSCFDIRAKATISQEYCARTVLQCLLSSVCGKSDGPYEEQEDGKLADKLQKLLKGRRYLVFIDDVWTKGAWDDIKLCFPDCNCRSRILLTTRNMEVAEYASTSDHPYHMSLLNFDESWNLLYKKVFVQECFSPEFEQLGKQIALKCRGLPLAVVVIAGLLTKISKTLDAWKSVAEDITSLVSTDLDVQCLRVLALSYHHLPHHLKACFLYFAIFPEDKLIFVNKLVKLWVAEGFLKVDEMKNIEEVAVKCLHDLIDRNLIFSHISSFDGKIKICGMHDMIRELCLKEAQKINFVNVIPKDQSPCAQFMHLIKKDHSRVSIQSVANQLDMVCSNESRSIFLFIRSPSSSRIMQDLVLSKVLRVLDLASLSLDDFPSCIVDLYHLRYLHLTFDSSIDDRDIYIPSSIANLQYLQVLILKFQTPSACQNIRLIIPLDIFKMSQLRHLSLDRNYLDQHHEPRVRSWILKNLQSLYGWNPLYCTSSVFRQFPNLKKLQICDSDMKGIPDLCYLDQLEELTIKWMPYLVLPQLGAFPKNLKTLAFTCTCFPLEDLKIVGKLPKLESLRLAYDACVGVEWEVVEEGFPHLKFLLLKFMGIKYWRASSDHFPSLERLFVQSCSFLDSIPQDFADITTLALIDITRCAESVGNSAKLIQQDIQDNYAGSVEVRIS